jgi:formylmethanofuran dehydrogenase subunit A
VSGRLRIVGGRVYDPANAVDGEVRDVCVEDGRIVADLGSDAPTLDARGLVVMPGGVDLHTHIAGPTVNLARRLTPEGRAIVPSTPATGRLYALLGYTTALDAAVPLLGARHAHLELHDTPLLDKGFYVVLGNDGFLLRALEAGDAERARDTVAWAVAAARAYGVKVVNPGGGFAWKRTRAIPGLDDLLGGTRLTPRRILASVAAAVDALDLPHPMHLHCSGLGLPGNASTTLETMGALEGRRAHLAHLQFHSYGGEPGGRPTSRAREVIEELNRRRNLSADVGQVLFGPAMAMSADSRIGEMLHDLTGRKWADLDMELDAGCGVIPYEYRERSVVHATQWAVGLELLLLSDDPWRLVLSTDHPNGATFLSYPRIVRLLMDRSFRDEQIARLPREALAGTALADGLSREYSLSEIAIVTRAGPARLLGLPGKGHLAPGADADVTIYMPDPDAEKMFLAPRHVLKAGERVVEDGQLRREVRGRTLSLTPEHDRAVERSLRKTLAEEGSLALEDYVVGPDEIGAC